MGTLPGTLAERMLRAAGAEVRTYDGGQEDPYRDLALGRTDAVLLDAPIALYYGERPELTTLPAGFGELRYAVVARAGDTRLRDALDAALDSLNLDGTLPALLQRWGLWTDEAGRVLGVTLAPSGPTVELDAWRARRTEGMWSAGVGPVPLALARGAGVTLWLSVAAMALAVALGAALALARVYGPAPLSALALGYVELFRGTPLLLQLIVVYYGLPELGLKLNPFVAGCARAGAQLRRRGSGELPGRPASGPARRSSTPRGCWGSAAGRRIRHVIGPQALRVALPPMTNDFIALLKDSSLVSVVTLTELTKTYGTLAAATRDHLGLGLLVGAIYLLLGLPFARLSRWVERRLGEHLEVTR